MAAVLKSGGTMTSVHNPYPIGLPPNPDLLSSAQFNVWAEGQFVGRESELGRLRRAVKDPSFHVVLIEGARRVGKTSLLRRLQGETRKYAAVAYLDARDVEEDSNNGGDSLLSALRLLTERLRLVVGGRWKSAIGTGSVERFRREVLPAIAAQAWGRRLVVLIDEVEALSDETLSVLLAAFHNLRSPVSPLVILSFGHRLGLGYSEDVGHRIKAPLRIELGAFSESETSGVLPDRGMPVCDFDAQARAQIWRLTKGHPLLTTHLLHEIFEVRATTPSLSPRVTGKDVISAIPQACVQARDGIWHAWRQSSAVQAVITKAVSERTDEGVLAGDINFTRSVSLANILVELEGEKRIPDRAVQITSLSGLVDDLILEEEPAGHYRLRSPFLGYWLKEHSYEYLLTAHTQAAKKAYEDATKALDRGDRELALKKLKEALRFNPFFREANEAAAELYSATGNLDEAIRLFQMAAQAASGKAKERLIELLEQQVLTTGAGKGDPLPWYQKLREADPEFARSSKANAAICEYLLERWRECMKAGSTDAAQSHFQNLAALNPANWRPRAVEAYADFLEGYVSSEEQLIQCVAAVATAFDLLSEERLPAELYLGKVTAEIDEELAADPVALKRVRAALQRVQRSPRAWLLTVEVLDRFWGHHLDDNGMHIPAGVLARLAQRAPNSVKTELSTCYRQHLPERIGKFLRVSLTDALVVFQLLADGGLPEVTALLDGLDDGVLHLEEAADDVRTLDFFEAMPQAYRLVLDRIRDLDASNLYSRVADNVEMLLNRLKRPSRPNELDGPWSLVVRAEASLDAWKNLFEHPVLRGLGKSKLLIELITLPNEVARRHDSRRMAAPADWYKDAEAMLQADFEGLEYEERVIPGVPSDLLRTYRAKLGSEPVNIKVYRLPEGNLRVRSFLTGLWENERRVLFDVGTRSRGRGLTQLKLSQIHPLKDRLFVVTEAVGPENLRQLLNRRSRLRLGNTATDRLLQPSGRGDLWREILALLEAVDSLHEHHYLHRAIRPENIYLHASRDARCHLKLGNFEWSLYLHSFTHYRTVQHGHFDRYFAPEVLSGIFGKQPVDCPAGESYSSDIYALGLVLFELLVEPLTDLGSFVEPSSYSLESHLAWAERVRRRIDDDASLDVDTRYLLREMIEPDVRRRRSALTKLIEVVRLIALGAQNLQESLNRSRIQFATTLRSEYTESIWKHLGRVLDLSNLPAADGARKDWIEKELGGARIYRNGSSPQRPLFLETRRCAFAIAPFIHNDVAYSEIPYLTVATPADARAGEMLARLPDGVDVLDISQVRSDIENGDYAPHEARSFWNHLMELARKAEDGLPTDLRDFHTVLGITAEVERTLWQSHVLPYRLCERSDGGSSVEQATIASVGQEDTDEIARFVAQQAGRELVEFELSSNQNPLAAFDESRMWSLDRIQNGRVVLQRTKRLGFQPPPDTGYLRPRSLRGNRALYGRRLDTLRRLEEDAYLLASVKRGSQVRLGSHELVRFYTPGLDEEKQRIVREAIRHSLFAVQGPPGTGKTTLASEIIQQTLHANPSARILITSQAHDPLDNLLKRVEEALEKNKPSSAEKSKSERRLLAENWKRQRPLSVRLMTSDRLSTMQAAGTEAGEIADQYHPIRVAERRLKEAETWQPDPGGHLPPTVVEKWRELARTARSRLSVALQRRITESANLVYATANDRSIRELLSDRQSFDLLIFEEAAKAYPLEVLAPMQLARQWLLIGDQDQLPPFNIEAFRDEFKPLIDALVRGPEHVRKSRYDTPLDRVALTAEAARETKGIADFFAWLHARGWNARQPSAGRLEKQWRMHPDIGDLLQHTYYRFLKNANEDELRRTQRHKIVQPQWLRNRALVWIDVPLATGPEADELSALAGELPFTGGGYRNPYEATVLVSLMKRVQTSGVGGFNKDIAFLSPYLGQVRLMNRFFHGWDRKSNSQTGDLRGRAFTVDGFQGRQAGTVVVSLVRNNATQEELSAYGFLTSVQRAGVMFSRAQALLIVIGCSAHFSKNPGFHLAKVYRYIRQCGLVVDAREILEQADYERLREHNEQRQEQLSRRSRNI